MKTQSISLALALVLLCHCASAQWVQTNGPHLGFVQCFAAADTNIFAGTRNLGGVYGVFRSTNNGVSWGPTGLMNYEIWSLAVAGTRLFAGTYGNGIFLSTNSGETWTLLDNRFEIADVRALAVCGTRIFAGTAGGGVFRSTDNGNTWTQTSFRSWVNALAVCGTTLFAGTDVEGIFSSTDNGESWTKCVNTAYGIVSAMTASATTVFAAGYAGVYRTTDGGVSWTDDTAGIPEAATVNAVIASGKEVFAGTYTGVYSSTDNGTTWAETGLKYEDVRALAVSGQSLLAGTLRSGVHLSLDLGASWSWTGFPTSTVNALACSDSILFAGTEGWVCLSTTSGTSWVRTIGPTPSGADFTDVITMAVSGPNLFAAGCTAQMYGCSFGIYRSTDNGMSWSEGGNPPPAGGSKWAPPQLCLVASGSNLFAGGVGVYLSTDEGTSWGAVSDGLPKTKGDTSRYQTITSLASRGAMLVAGMADGVFLSTNSGANWTQTGLHTGVNALAISGENIFAGTDSAGIFRTTDNGATWSSVNEGLPKSPSGTTKYVPVTMLFPHGTLLYAGSPGNGVFFSSSVVPGWTEANSGLTNTNVKSLEVLGTNLFAGTYGGGVWRRPLSEMTTAIGPPAGGLPHRFLLQQNYPNPFNPVTTIRFELPGTSQVILGVYDILGREIAVLVNERMDAGVHEVRFDGSTLASGMYFYTLQAGGFTQTKRLLIVR